MAAVWHDVWASQYPEPVDGDQGVHVRRYGFTFPCNDPVKRIDMLLAGTCTPQGPGLAPCSDVRAAQRAGSSEGDDEGDVNAGPGPGGCVRVHRAYLVGQDPLPGTEGGEGRRAGMVSEYSPIYASDHRALVAHLSLAYMDAD